MTQCEIDRAVASVTGESPREISHLGFSLADCLERDFDPEPWERPPAVMNWDEFDALRPALFP
jgi:hypothetical protein